MDIFKTEFQYYSNDATKPHPLGYLSLEKFINAIRNPGQRIKQTLSEIEEAVKNGDEKTKSELKKTLYSVTPCVNVNKRRAYEDIIKFTGISVLDFDKIEYADEFKMFLFKTYSSVIAAWLSPSGKGVKALVRIPIVHSTDEYKSYFYGIASEMEMYKGFDATTQNAVLLLFMGCDENILVRSNPTTWNIKGKKKGQLVENKEINYNVSPTSEQSGWVIEWYKKSINNIVSDGHPQLRNSSVALGGYVGSGYLSYIDALNLSYSLIEANGYLQKGVSGYKKTAKQAIELGIRNPLTFK